MDIYEIAGWSTGVSKAGVNFLQPSDSFQNIINGYIYRQVLQSRQGSARFAPRVTFERIMGIFEHTPPNGIKELLVFSTDFMFRYNTATGVFDFIPFGGSLAGYPGFRIAEKYQYISGVSYPTAPLLSTGLPNPRFINDGNRFVFTSTGIIPNGTSSVFFYDGTEIRDFTNIGDNPNYAAPPQGALNNAKYVIWFNSRINFVYPTIAATPYAQGVLYSGDTTRDGNGDKFNVPGSGLFQADTYQVINGATILGQVLVLNFDRMNYVLEKTRDAFNPYFGRAVPGVLGTNADFSAVSWDDQVKSIGRTGVIGCDARQTLRVDDKIPYFTADEIDQDLFNLTYGGFDRVNNQFLWAYKESETDSLTQDWILVNNYEENTWSFYTQKFSVFGQTDLGKNYTWDEIEAASGNPSWDQWNTTDDIWDTVGLTRSTQKTLAGDDLGYVYEINKDYDDYFTTILNIVPGPTTTILLQDMGIAVGDRVSISNVGGMTEINNFDPNTNEQINEYYYVLSVDNVVGTVTINVDSSLFTAYTVGGTISSVIDFAAETIPFNPYRQNGRRCYISHVEFLIDTNGGTLHVDVYDDLNTTPFKRDVLLQPTRLQQASEWIDMSVDHEANFITFVMKQTSPSVQVRLKSMRIHCQPGGMTSG